MYVLKLLWQQNYVKCFWVDSCIRWFK